MISPLPLSLETAHNGIVSQRLFFETHFQQFRFRALQLLHELENVIVRLDESNPSTTATLTPNTKDPAEMRAEAMIQALCSTHYKTPANENANARSIWIVVLLLVLVGISLLSWVALKNWIPH